MQLVVLASIVASTAVGSWVGWLLIRTSRRTGELPELYVGVALLVYAAISQPLALGYELLPAEAPATLRMAFSTARLVGFYVTLVGLAAFVCRVFGATSRVRIAIAAGAALAGLPGYGLALVHVWSQIAGGASPGLFGRLGMTPSFIAVYAWSGFESLRYHGMMRRRRSLGLADPVVTNRFLVWGLGSAAGAATLSALAVTSLLPGHDQATSVLISASGLVSTATWWLAFAPPRSYTDWLRQSASPR